LLVCSMTSISRPPVASRVRAAELNVGLELEEAVQRHARLVYKVAYSALRRADEAEDATQETFLRLLKYPKRFERADDPAAFISRVAWRVALDRLRRRKIQAEVPLEQNSEVVRTMRTRGKSTEEIAVSREMQQLLERLVASLPRKLRDVVRLSTVEEMQAKEIAAVLKIPEASVRTRLFRARAILKEKAASLLATPMGRST
jgi:RNA polymerase sigma-70 factor (ECF subfamily)